jgi:spore germination cell wall hydrolase CwlJ-like protein
MGLALFAVAALGGQQKTDLPATSIAVETPAGDASAPEVVKAGILPEFTSSAATLLAVDPFRGTPSQPQGAANARDLECLTEAVYFESRGQPLAGQQAVAQVVLNRTRHPAYPKSVCAVTYQGRERRSCQFSYACHPRAMRRESSDYRIAREVAEAALNGSMRDVVGTAVSFHATRVRPGWGGMIRVSTIGDHVFYKFAGAKGASSTFASAPQPSRADNVGSLGSALMAAVQRPMHRVSTTPVVKTATPPPAPLLGFGPDKTTAVAATSPTVAPAHVAPVAPVAAPAMPVAAPTETPVLQPTSAAVDAPSSAAATTVS